MPDQHELYRSLGAIEQGIKNLEDNHEDLKSELRAIVTLNTKRITELEKDKAKLKTIAGVVSFVVSAGAWIISTFFGKQ